MILYINLRNIEILKFKSKLYHRYNGTLLSTMIKGNRDLYSIEQAYSMFDIKVVGFIDRTTSMT